MSEVTKLHYIMECIQKFQALNQQLKKIKKEVVNNEHKTITFRLQGKQPLTRYKCLGQLQPIGNFDLKDLSSLTQCIRRGF